MYSESRLAHNWLAKRNVNLQAAGMLTSLTGTVVDLGCGTRPFEPDILRYAETYVGVDWSNTLHGNHANIVADLNQPLPFVDGCADHVVTFEVIEHLAEPAVMLREALRILRPGGTLVLSMPFQWWIHEEPWDYQRYTIYGLDYQLRKAGFVGIEIAPTCGFWSMWLLKLNYQTARLIRGPKAMRRVIRACLIPLWWCDQTVAPWLDRMWPEPRETAGYFATARKPYPTWIRSAPARTLFGDTLLAPNALHTSYLDAGKTKRQWSEHLAGQDHAVSYACC